VRWCDAGGEHVLFESGAILMDFAARHGRLLPAGGAAREAVMTWLMVALTGLGPMMGQAHHWTDLAPVKPPEAVQHTVSLVRRIFGVLDGRLAAVPYLGGDDFSIADIAAFPWIARSDWATLDRGEWPALAAWHDRVAARPAVQAGMAVPKGAKLEG
jgi:GST-like protein